MKTLSITLTILSLLSVGGLMADEPKAVFKLAESDTAKTMGAAKHEGDTYLLEGKKAYLHVNEDKDFDLHNGGLVFFAEIKIVEGAKGRCGIVSKGAGSNEQAGYAFMYRPERKALYLYLCDGKARQGFQSKDCLLADGKWHKVAVSVTRAEHVTFYVDGKNRGKRTLKPFTDTDITSGLPLTIGSWNNAHFLQGSIKQFDFYKSSLEESTLIKLTE